MEAEQQICSCRGNFTTSLDDDPWNESSPEETSQGADHSAGFPQPAPKAATPAPSAGFSADPWETGQKSPDCIMHRGRLTNIKTLHFEGQERLCQRCWRHPCSKRTKPHDHCACCCQSCHDLRSGQANDRETI